MDNTPNPDSPVSFTTAMPKPNPLQVLPPPKSGFVTAATLVLVAATVWAGYSLQDGMNLFGILLGLVLFLITVGWTIVKRPTGALINSQNLMSLSRFQMLVWTLVVLASYFSFALTRMRLNIADPLNVDIDGHLLALIGISAASFVGAPLILSTKKDKEPDPDSTVKAAAKTGESCADVEENREGTLYANTNVADARFTDMFQGDEIGNTTHVDLAKVQMFFFTIIAALTYLMMVYHALNSPDELSAVPTHLPILSEGVVAAIGISHAGYLGSKGIDHTPAQK